MAGTRSGPGVTNDQGDANQKGFHRTRTRNVRGEGAGDARGTSLGPRRWAGEGRGSADGGQPRGAPRARAPPLTWVQALPLQQAQNLPTQHPGAQPPRPQGGSPVGERLGGCLPARTHTAGHAGRSPSPAGRAARHRVPPAVVPPLHVPSVWSSICLSFQATSPDASSRCPVSGHPQGHLGREGAPPSPPPPPLCPRPSLAPLPHQRPRSHLSRDTLCLRITCGRQGRRRPYPFSSGLVLVWFYRLLSLQTSGPDQPHPERMRR